MEFDLDLALAEENDRDVLPRVHWLALVLSGLFPLSIMEQERDLFLISLILREEFGNVSL